MSQAKSLPLHRDASSRFLPWFIAFIVWLAIATLAAVLLLSSFSDQWRRDYTGTLTIQIPAVMDETNMKNELRLNSALRLLQNTPGISSAKTVSIKRLSKILAPWLGSESVSQSLGLPIPRLIEVKFKPDTNLDISALRKKLEQKVEGALLDDHSVWLDRLITLADVIETVAFSILLLLSAAATTIVIFATRTSLVIHQDLIDLLHIMGARDNYVARQFHRHVMYLSLKGGAIGTIFATATLYTFDSIWSDIDLLILPQLTLNFWQWSCMFFIPVAVAVITALTARITVFRVLRHLT